ncbi:MAG TPA: tail fiber protein [Oleiagrimonas sp.]|nr:tail fiber protein [Oleiagrimonas sp.]
MSDKFVGQIMLVGFNFAPAGFATCDGQLLPIVQNQALFALLGTTYGGDGRTTFQLPDLRGRTPLGFSNSLPLGASAGSETVTLTSGQLPTHLHVAQASTSAGTTHNPAGSVFGGSGTENLYAPTGQSEVPLDASTIAPAGGSQPHENMQPFNVLNFCIALQGIFPSRD